MWLKRLVFAGVLFGTGLLCGCSPDNKAAIEPTANSQKSIPDKNPEANSPYTKDQKDQKAAADDEASSKG